MSEYKYLIVGGGIAGTSAAEVIRQNDKSGTIAIVTDEPDRLYSRILLSKPNFFLERIPFDQIWLKDSSWYEQNSISLLAQKKAVSLDLVSKKILLDDGSAIGYRKLFASAGALSVLRCAICSGLPELKLLWFFASRTIGSPFLIKFRASLLKKRLKKEELKFFAILKLLK